MKKRVGNIIDIENNEKIKSSKGYEYWATKHNLKTAADTVLLMREKGFKSSVCNFFCKLAFYG